MKKLIVSLVVAACAASTALVQAQEEPKRPAAGAGEGARGRVSPEDRLKMLTSSLGLNQEQQDKVKKILEDSRPDLEKVRSLPQEERRAKFREITQAQNAKIAEVLTPEQKEKFKAAMANRGQARAGRGTGEGANAPKKEGEKPPGEGQK